jgi:hypothetical protein
MKAGITTLFALWAASASVMAATSFPDITTSDGVTYSHITARRVDPDGLYLEYAPNGSGLGVAKVKFSRLSPDLQKEFGYNADASKQFEEENYKGTLAYNAWADKQDAAREKAETEANDREFQLATILAQRPPVPVAQAPSDNGANGAYYGGYPYYGYGYGFGFPAPRNAFTGATYTGNVPFDRLFAPIGFQANKTQVITTTPRFRANANTAPVEHH